MRQFRIFFAEICNRIILSIGMHKLYRSNMRRNSSRRPRIGASGDGSWRSATRGRLPTPPGPPLTSTKASKASWSDDLRKAWREAETETAAAADGRAKRAYEKAKAEAKASTRAQGKGAPLARGGRQAFKARMDAEAQFDEADRRPELVMACEGAQMAIDAWVMREKFIRKMEALARVGHSGAATLRNAFPRRALGRHC